MAMPLVVPVPRCRIQGACFIATKLKEDPFHQQLLDELPHAMDGSESCSEKRNTKIARMM